MDRTLLYRIPKEGVTSGAILVSRLPIYGAMGARAQVMNSVLQKPLVGKEEAKDNTEREQPITHDAKHGLTRKVTARRYINGDLLTISRLDCKTSTS